MISMYHDSVETLDTLGFEWWHILFIIFSLIIVRTCCTFIEN